MWPTDVPRRIGASGRLTSREFQAHRSRSCAPSSSGSVRRSRHGGSPGGRRPRSDNRLQGQARWRRLQGRPALSQTRARGVQATELPHPRWVSSRGSRDPESLSRPADVLGGEVLGPGLERLLHATEVGAAVDLALAYASRRSWRSWAAAASPPPKSTSCGGWSVRSRPQTARGRRRCGRGCGGSASTSPTTRGSSPPTSTISSAAESSSWRAPRRLPRRESATGQAVELARRDDKHRFMHAFPSRQRPLERDLPQARLRVAGGVRVRVPKGPLHDRQRLAPGTTRLDSTPVQPKVALTPTCAECGDVWLPADTDRWKLIFDAYDELVWVCPECDEREFGSGG